MHQAIPYTNNNFGYNNINQNEHYYCNNNNKKEVCAMMSMVSENAVIVIGKQGCCMTHVVKRLLQSLGVNPMIHEVEDEKDEVCVAKELESLIGNCNNVQFPMVFIGGKLFGGLDRLMATHISGELVPLLKQAGALWL